MVNKRWQELETRIKVFKAEFRERDDEVIRRANSWLKTTSNIEVVDLIVTSYTDETNGYNTERKQYTVLYKIVG